MDIDILVHDDEVFGEHHLSHAPESVHDFVGLHGVGFPDADGDEVVEGAFGGEGDVHNFGEIHSQDREEEFDGGCSDVEVLHGWDADDGGWVGGISSVGDGRDMEHGVGLGQGVESGVIPERTLLSWGFGGVYIALDDDVGIGWHFQVDGFAFYEVDRFPSEVAGEKEFVQAVGQGGGGAEGEDGVAAEDDGDGHAGVGFVVAASVASGDFLELPVHAGGLVIVDLHSVHADIPFAGVRIAGDDAGEGDEPAAVEGPALEDGKIGEGGKGKAWCGGRG